ncbi:serine threonine- kinase Nek4-like protein [Labeo rohita]|uniref:non-specific serine/threonine protein kinase n=1 Tax=Labeo rohita TaxID=84645 RepID=A0A498L4X0_LABRO|nr:serine threonine- kinase Nek4-like protein [Labeo rohita]
MASVSEQILDALDDLDTEKLKRFKWHLKNYKGFSAADLEKADAPDTVDLMMKRFGPEEAVKITVDILRKMNHNHLAEELENKHKQAQAEGSIEDPALSGAELKPTEGVLKEHGYTIKKTLERGDLESEFLVTRKDGDSYVIKEINCGDILDWMVQICLALQYLYENNVLHRNIKPQNVFLTEHGFVNIEVFGCFEKDSKGLKSDIWSLGFLLHNLCMLDVWPDITCADALSKKVNLPHISERYSEELRRLIRQMLSCDPKVRPSAEKILAKPFLKNAVKKNKRVPDTLEERFMKSTENFDEAYRDSEEFLSEWKNITDSLEEIHRKCTIGSLSGSVIGAAGGITAIVGAILAPFTLGASLIVTGVGIGVSVAGGITATPTTLPTAVRTKETPNVTGAKARPTMDAIPPAAPIAAPVKLPTVVFLCGFQFISNDIKFLYLTTECPMFSVKI